MGGRIEQDWEQSGVGYVKVVCKVALIQRKA